MKITKFIALFVVLCVNSSFAADDPIVRFAALDYCPLVCNPTTEPSGRKGIMVDIVEHIFKKENLKVTVSIMPFKRARNEVKKGLYDGMIAGDIFQAPTFIYPKNPILKNYAQMFALRGTKWKFKGIESLDNIRLLSVKEFGYKNKPIEDYLNRATRDKVTQMEGSSAYTSRGIALLKRRSADVYIEGTLAFKYISWVEGCSERFIPVSGILSVFNNYASFSPKKKRSHKLAAIVDKHLPGLHESGKIREILKRYGISND